MNLLIAICLLVGLVFVVFLGSTAEKQEKTLTSPPVATPKKSTATQQINPPPAKISTVKKPNNLSPAKVSTTPKQVDNTGFEDLVSTVIYQAVVNGTVGESSHSHSSDSSDHSSHSDHGYSSDSSYDCGSSSSDSSSGCSDF